MSFGFGGKKQSEKQRQKVYSHIAVKGFQSLRDGCAALDSGRIVALKAGIHCLEIFYLGLAFYMFTFLLSVYVLKFESPIV